jgi:phosphoenolpyruvate carboxykinase (ATP)
MITLPAMATLDFGTATVHHNLGVPRLIETAIRCGEGELAANGALMCDTGDRTGRSPNDKFLEDTSGIHDSIHWGKVNQPISQENFRRLEARAIKHLSARKELFRFDGLAGADPDYRLKVSVVTELAWHCLFAKTWPASSRTGRS